MNLQFIFTVFFQIFYTLEFHFSYFPKECLDEYAAKFNCVCSFKVIILIAFIKANFYRDFLNKIFLTSVKCFWADLIERFCRQN
jgi:hypothetical protein